MHFFIKIWKKKFTCDSPQDLVPQAAQSLSIAQIIVWLMQRLEIGLQNLQMHCLPMAFVNHLPRFDIC